MVSDTFLHQGLATFSRHIRTRLQELVFSERQELVRLVVDNVTVRDHHVAIYFILRDVASGVVGWARRGEFWFALAGRSGYPKTPERLRRGSNTRRGALTGWSRSG